MFNMKIMKPEPFTFEAGPRAVLLLHGFTGHSADVRMLGRFLEKKGYTSHAPIYKGHGVEPEELIKTTPEDWWQDAQEGYEYLKFLGYQEIAIAGLSLGGVFTLKLAAENPVKGIVPMCTPVYFDNETQLTKGFNLFAKQYKQFLQMDEADIETEVKSLMTKAEPLFEKIEPFIHSVRDQVEEIYTPAFIAQSVHDEIINPESADYIKEHLASDEKKLKWFHKSGHVVTTGPEREELHEDIYMFLENLNWEQ